MRRRSRFGIGLVALILALALISGTGAFSAITGERGTQVTVVDDGDAYLGIEQSVEEPEVTAIEGNGTTSEGNTTTESSAANRTTDEETADSTSDTNVTAGTAVAGTTANATTPAQTGPTVDLTVTNRFSQSVTVGVTVDGDSESASLDAGESHTFTFESVECGEQITVTASGSSVETTMDRTVECD